MLEGFEDAFVDAQSRVVSLCLELLKNSEKEADKIYIYLFQNDEEDYIAPCLFPLQKTAPSFFVDVSKKDAIFW